VMVAALTIYDMCKSADRTMTVGEVALWEKSGGRAGAWRREKTVANTITEQTEDWVTGVFCVLECSRFVQSSAIIT
jgi:hypothetical protein